MYVTYFLLQACKDIKLVLFTIYLWIDFPTMSLKDIMVLLFLIIAPSGGEMAISWSPYISWSTLTSPPPPILGTQFM